jgi:hypothetical protein
MNILLIVVVVLLLFGGDIPVGGGSTSHLEFSNRIQDLSTRISLPQVGICQRVIRALAHLLWHFCPTRKTHFW